MKKYYLFKSTVIKLDTNITFKEFFNFIKQLSNDIASNEGIWLISDDNEQNIRNEESEDLSLMISEKNEEIIKAFYKLHG